ncbi:hypothetical protein [Nesterenkonia rhizosphaerae]|uniref:DUF1983 domain-containing protein n=1 Tax=Nesterenkonia rhizosphaerae TaxID=1348272 RepID=A0ABP9FZC3_9MICC
MSRTPSRQAPPRRIDPDTQLLMEQVRELTDRVKDLAAAPRLAHASIDDGYLPIMEKGKEAARLGRMPDGSFGHRVTVSPPQPTPTAPVLTVLELGAMEVTWDGAVVTGYVPEVHGRTDVLIAFSEDGEEPPAAAYHVASSIRDREGGSTTVICPKAGTWFAKFQMVGADRKTRGEFSATSSARIVPPVDTEAIREELEGAREERREFQERFDERTGTYDRLMDEQRGALAAQEAWSATAQFLADEAAAQAVEARAVSDDAVRSAHDAQSKYDEVSSRQDATEEEIEAARRAAAEAHKAAGDAYQYAVSIADRLNNMGQAIRSTTPPTGTAEDGTFWRQYDNMTRERKLIGWWEFRDGAWDQIELSLSILPRAEIGQAVIDDLRAERLFAEVAEIAELVTEDLIIRKLVQAPAGVINRLITETNISTEVWSQLVRTAILEAEEAYIDGTLIAARSLTGEHITDSLIFEVAQGIKLEVDNLASNEIVGFIIRGGVLEGPLWRSSPDWETRGGAAARADGSDGNFAANDRSGTPTFRAGGDRSLFAGELHMTHQERDRRFVLAPEGFRLERDVGDGDWAATTSLGTGAEGDRLTMVDEQGETGFAADAQHVSARTLETDNDILVAGERLVGDLLDYEHPAARFQPAGILDGLGRGIAAYGARDVANYRATHRRMTPLRLRVENIPRRRFVRVEVPPIWLDTLGNEVRGFITVGNRSTGAPGGAPLISSGGDLSSLDDVVAHISTHATPGSDGRAMLGPMIWYANTQASEENWTLDVHLTSTNGFTILGPLGGRHLEMIVTDLGPAVDNSALGVDFTGSGTVSTSGGTTPAPAPPTWVPRQRTYTPGNFRNWAADGRILGSSGASTSLPVSRNMFQGQIPSSSFGYVRSAAFFGNHWGVPANARMISGSVKIRWSHTYNGSGAIARFMRHNVATTPTNRPTLNTLGTAHGNRGGWAVYNLSAQQLDWMRGTSPAIRGFGLGDGSGGIGAYAYGAQMEVTLRWEEQA